MRKINSKKAQGGLFGMSFSMIFSIILIIFFIAAAFTAIKYFLNLQRCSQVGMFTSSLQNKIDIAWNSQSSLFYFNASIPSGIKSVCFVNLSSPPKNANTYEKNMFTEIQNTGADNMKSNFYIYAPEKDYCGLKWKTINHIDLSKKNPICITAKNGIISIKIERNFEDALVRVGS